MIDQSDAHQTIDELLRAVGSRIRLHRLNADISQSEAAKRAGVSLRALRQLELEGRSTLETAIRVLRALDVLEPANFIVSEPVVSPMALIRTAAPPKRARRKTAKP